MMGTDDKQTSMTSSWRQPNVTVCGPQHSGGSNKHANRCVVL